MSANIITKNEENCNIEIEIIKDTGEILVDLSATGRERPWSPKKKENVELVELLEIIRQEDEYFISDNQLQSVKDCGTYLKFGITPQYERKLAGANFCRYRICPMCAWRRSLKMFAQVSAITDAILRDKPNIRFLFLTLTVKNFKGENLRETIKKMNEGFRRIVKNTGHYKASKKLRKNLLGYLKAIEVTYNEKRDDYHPHFHIILEVDPEYFSFGNYLTQKEFKIMWRELMQMDYDPQVDIRIIKNSTAKAVAEVAKYPIKIKSILSVKNKIQAAHAVKNLKNGISNLRFVEFGGDFKTYKKLLELDDIEDGDLTHIETDRQNLNYIAYQIFRYDFKSGFYVC